MFVAQANTRRFVPALAALAMQPQSLEIALMLADPPPPHPIHPPPTTDQPQPPSKMAMTPSKSKKAAKAPKKAGGKGMHAPLPLLVFSFLLSLGFRFLASLPASAVPLPLTPFTFPLPPHASRRPQEGPRGELRHLHLQGAQAGAPRHRHLQARYVTDR